MVLVDVLVPVLKDRMICLYEIEYMNCFCFPLMENIKHAGEIS